jgi:hypothetical protein
LIEGTKDLKAEHKQNDFKTIDQTNPHEGRKLSAEEISQVTATVEAPQ